MISQASPQKNQLELLHFLQAHPFQPFYLDEGGEFIGSRNSENRHYFKPRLLNFAQIPPLCQADVASVFNVPSKHIIQPSKPLNHTTGSLVISRCKFLMLPTGAASQHRVCHSVYHGGRGLLEQGFTYPGFSAHSTVEDKG